MKYNLYLILFLAIFFIFNCSKNQILEKEPNDSFWNAQNVSIPCSIKGKVSNFDSDYYKILFTEDRTNCVDIELDIVSLGNLQIDFYAQNTLVKSTHLLNKNNKKIFLQNLSLTRGVYYIKISKYKGVEKYIKYFLKISSRSFLKNLEQEPNDNFGNATPINITNGYIKGNFSPIKNFALKAQNFHESDWYKFFMSSGSNIVTIEITSIPGVDSVIELYDNLGILLKKSDSLGIDEPEILKNFGIREPGEYYIKVYSKTSNYNNIQYQLYVTVKKFNPAFEFEPNESLSQANLIKNAYVQGFINPAGDVDWYKLEIKEKSIVNISVTPLNNVDLVLSINNQNGISLKILNYFGISKAEYIPDLMLEPGIYYITLRDSNYNQNYLDSYTLTVKKEKFSEFLGYEPNDNFEEAILIQPNHSYKGYISPVSDKDFFVFFLNEDRKIKLEISPVPNIDFIVKIFDQNFNLIKEINNGSSGEGESDLLTLTSGKFYIMLSDADNKDNFNENYLLSIYER